MSMIRDLIIYARINLNKVLAVGNIRHYTLETTIDDRSFHL